MSSSRDPNSSKFNEDQWSSKGRVSAPSDKFPTIQYAVNLINFRVGDVQNNRSAYMKVSRERDKRNEEKLTRDFLAGYNQTQDQTGSMLQRWQRESMLDQPYNNIEAVKKRASCTNDKQVSERSNTKSSLGYFDPQAKPQ